MMDYKDAWLCALLDCGIADLSALEDCKFNYTEIIEEAWERWGMEFNINALLNIIIEKGLDEMHRSLEKRKARLKENERINEFLNEEQQAEYDALQEMEPYNDIHFECNYCATQVWFDAERDNYMRYAQAEVERFTEMTGFEIMT